jgi:hypothetical protein
MTREIEHIFRSKRFVELNAHERLLISEYAKNEDEYEGMRLLLLQAHEVAQETQVVPPSIKRRLDQLFDQKYAAARLAWYNRLWLFLWPEQTRMIQRPALQLAMLLTLVVFAIGLFPKLEQERLALVSPEEKETVKTDDSSTNDDEKVSEIREQQGMSQSNLSADEVVATENLQVNAELQREEMETLNDTRTFVELRSDREDVLLPTPDESIALEEDFHTSYGNVSEPISEVVAFQDSEIKEKMSKRVANNSKTVDVLDLLTALY